MLPLPFLLHVLSSPELGKHVTASVGSVNVFA